MKKGKRGVCIDEKICITCNLDLTNEPRLEVHMYGECADKIVNKDYVLVKREVLQFLIEMAKLGCDMNFDWDSNGYKKFRRIKEEYNIE